MEVSGRAPNALLPTLLLFTLPVLFTLNALFELSALREIYPQDYPNHLYENGTNNSGTYIN